ncbi:MAG: response regulator transcription factor [Flavobacteriales bacterium]|nr:response regulator transcription factor [Flavobacteriales bacterium]
MTYRIAIVEDRPDLIASLLEKLSIIDQSEVVWVANNGREAIDKVTNHQPDLIFMDIQMPVMDGITACEAIHSQYPNIKIVMLTVMEEDDLVFRSIMAGASGYLLKDSKIQDIEKGILDVMDGGAPMSPSIAMKSLRLIRAVSEKPKTSIDFGLSKRELEILEEMSGGLNYKEIAEKMFISPKTVRKHIENVYRKLQVHNKVEAVRLAMDHKLI